MSDPFVAEIRMFGFNFAPTGWAQCNGQLLPTLTEHRPFFATRNNLRRRRKIAPSRCPTWKVAFPFTPGQGQGLSQYFLGQQGGSESVTLLDSEIPSHTHSFTASEELVNENNVTANFFGAGETRYAAPANLVQMAPQALSPAGGSLPHNNMMNYLVVNFCIALQGIFPPRP